MTAKTNAFKSAQVTKWKNGEVADGANFSQLITAIATLVDETKTETLSEAASGQVTPYTDANVKTLLNAVPFLEYQRYSYTSATGNVALVGYFGSQSGNIQITTGNELLRDTGSQQLRADVLSADGNLVTLHRADGARVVLNISARTVTPAAALIG